MREVPSQGVSKQTLQRLPVYLSYLKGLREAPKYISATAIAEALNMNHVVVRKDLASISSSGRPKVGYVREEASLARRCLPTMALWNMASTSWLGSIRTRSPSTRRWGGR